MTLSAPYFSIDRLANEIGTLLVVAQYGIHPRDGPGGKTGWHLFVVDPLASHTHNIGDIMYVDKPDLT